MKTLKWLCLGMSLGSFNLAYAELQPTLASDNNLNYKEYVNKEIDLIGDKSVDNTNIVKGSASLQSLTDEEMANTEAQALFNLSYIAPGQGTNTAAENKNVGFYTLSMEADVEINTNIKNLQLGCGGLNGANGCDIDIQNVSLGCIADANGMCITLPKSEARQLSGALQESGTGQLNWQQQMKSFKMVNPFFQFAIKNPNDASLREVVGIRVGSAHTSGPLSFGSLNNFSGYLTGKANLTMRGETNVGVTTKDVAYYQNASAYLGLDNGEILNWLVYRAYYRDVTANYSTVTRSDLPIELAGLRVQQTLIPNVMLGSVVDDIMGSLSLNQVCVRNVFDGCSIISGVANLLLPILKPSVGDYIKNQLAVGLGKPSGSSQSNHDWLNAYKLPYNLKNVHQLDVDSDVFGFALSAQALRYPGYAQAVNRGWSMYAPDAFTLNIDDKVSSLVSNIATSSNARDGNITLLPQAYRNCWGNLTFC